MVSCFSRIMKFRVLLIVCFLSVAFGALAYTPSTGDLNVADAATKTRLEGGKKLFKSNCASCHAVDKDLTGPALMNVWERWESEDKIIQWVKNNSSLRASGDAYANKIFNDWKGSVMTGFPSLTNENVIDIIDYVRAETANPGFLNAGATAPAVGAAVAPSGTSSNTMWWLIAALLAILAYGLSVISNKLKDVVDEKEGNFVADKRTALQKIFTPRVKSALKLFTILFLGAWLVKSAIGLGRLQTN